MHNLTTTGDVARDQSDLALTDPLTGLGNQRRFFDKVERLIRERADDPAPFAVGLLDLDGFKPINDLFGRKAGDYILQLLGNRNVRHLAQASKRRRDQRVIAFRRNPTSPRDRNKFERSNAIRVSMERWVVITIDAVLMVGR